MGTRETAYHYPHPRDFIFDGSIHQNVNVALERQETAEMVESVIAPVSADEGVVHRYMNDPDQVALLQQYDIVTELHFRAQRAVSDSCLQNPVNNLVKALAT